MILINPPPPPSLSLSLSLSSYSQAEAKVFVTVLDRNDNPPVFTHVQYSGTIVENSVPAQVVPLVSYSLVIAL